ncbi:MAG: BlaI/MecI/CopY family transcriptional regulator [Phenylobacterium sp.]|uniref:BlaI/MecI/CopY family transcriptional regulator n=1 Tax=Phenylobacterium sp. TaxID=1871053 RepID=UPI0012158373|nr:BlaI/MecI/CopY family transcriptional regulator [Phenylobacterium sp.]TAL38135.1 MAG: BlaI/MecI/CopY family transcriptional regulator [Phenylobacterium sp.]
MRISGAESLVMEALWRREPLTAEEIFAEVGEAQGWAEATLKTLLNRLLNKNAVSAQKDGRRYLYRPLVARDEYVESESQGLLDRLFDGRLAPLVSHFSERQKLTAQDIADLKRLIAELDDER